jgi:hypothetical protein
MNKLIFVIIFILCLIPLGIAPLNIGSADDLIYEKNTTIDLKVPCFNNNTFCSPSAICNITIIYPNASVLINNQLMTNGGAFHNYTLTSTNTIGEYQSYMVCNDGGELGYSTFTFMITPNGQGYNIGTMMLFGLIGILTLILALVCLFIGINSEKASLIISGIMMGFIFILVTLQTILLIPELQTNADLYSQVSLIYQISLWIFFLIVISIILYMITKVGKYATNPTKNNLKNWNLLMPDEK